ncbi:Sec-independent protein translocase subunit TatA [Promicromonospora sp. NPDC052451]|uniref:Sec-independent protein translocase subunit TatA n=1 Tax=Promicromonospora sp. NPDC052451 TaxID=3364407 RepID=UPI0037C51976
MGAMQPWHWIVLLVVVLLLFGSTRLPGLAKSVGQSMKIFRKEIKDMRDDGRQDGNDAATHAVDDKVVRNSPDATPGGSTSSGSTPGLIDNRDRDIPKA